MSTSHDRSSFLRARSSPNHRQWFNPDLTGVSGQYHSLTVLAARCWRRYKRVARSSTVGGAVREEGRCQCGRVGCGVGKVTADWWAEVGCRRRRAEYGCCHAHRTSIRKGISFSRQVNQLSQRAGAVERMMEMEHCCSPGSWVGDMADVSGVKLFALILLAWDDGEGREAAPWSESTCGKIMTR